MGREEVGGVGCCCGGGCGGGGGGVTAERAVI